MIFPSGKTYPWQVVDKLVLSSEMLAHCASAFADWKKIKQVFQSGYSTLLDRAATSYRYRLRSQIPVAPFQSLKGSRVYLLQIEYLSWQKFEASLKFQTSTLDPNQATLRRLAQLEASWPVLLLPDRHTVKTPKSLISELYKIPFRCKQKNC